MIRILIADDQELFAESLKTLLTTYTDDIEIVGIAENGRKAISWVENTTIDIILMDVKMPELDGVEATKIILQSHKSIKVVMLSTFKEIDFVKRALRYGALGYLLKDISPTELIASIRAAYNGATQISPAIAANIVESKYTDKDNNGTSIEWYKDLTKREKEIFKLISRGYDNTEIADELCIAYQTVRNYVSSIISKLGIKNRYEIIKLANRMLK
ncbi:response regulator transcription factor [Sediminispirochaeta smaragdinae]|jgi:DNA-binding NarL/FixJ family response regulator|uniref:Two component transcriptional regulator, LuxR family n=1 Tax=Sediminispirochaeta smaragdinae (strain DSM 11293 / JCM 15392 / SEBR 4228) TaxID=573413 RepID=E1R9K9_SEDSS|nr:response regulator transcription factor [Sediminispirochaeta smaragdinae]ADK83178.1 two component transcriptional regulator, LuxR family [Sediminispirochaeta smaragdinae DSM 11293]